MKLLALVAVALALVTAAPATDWTHRVTQTPQGAFVLGNPAAKQRLVEYVSYTCPHCAHFTNEASATLRTRYVANGSTAIEVRHAVRDPIDFAATLLARCTGPGRFFAVHEKLFATQDSWFEAGARYIEANRDALNKLPQTQQLQMLAKGAGLPAVVGMSEPQANACIANAAAQKPVLAMTTEAWEQRKIGGTPYFLVNGQGIENTASWAALQPHLKN